MSFWVLLQILVNIVIFAGLFLLWIKNQKSTQDDPKLSKGLQLLQSKISILEDLSDRTEVQVGQLTALLEKKCFEIQEKITLADRQIALIEKTTEKSLEVAQIFQDKIPHHEIIERQNTIKYVQAAKLAHEGLKPQEIIKFVDLSLAEVELIVKMNKDEMQFNFEALPEWAKVDPRSAQTTEKPSTASTSFMQQPLASAPISQAQATPQIESTLISKPQLPNQKFVEIDLRSPQTSAKNSTQKVQQSTQPNIKPFEFPRIY